MTDSERIKKDVLDLFRNHGKQSFRPKEVAKRLGYTDNKEYGLCRSAIEELAKSGDIARIKGNRFGHRPKAGKLEGHLKVHPDGYGFVSVEGHEQDYFVRARRMGTAIDGDLVRIGIAAQRKGDKRQSAEVLEVLERSRESAVGSFQHMGSFAVVVPDDKRLIHDIYVDKDAPTDAIDGDKVLVSIDAFEHKGAAPRGRILQVIGRADDPTIRTIAIAMGLGVSIDFDEELEKAAQKAARPVSDQDIKGRRDFREEAVFTIDPADARDFDDALHFKGLANGNLEIGIHIADVSHYVREGTALDREALARGTSVYLVDQVVPMLPESLSNGICSLVPDEDRLTFSCVVELTSDGDIVKDWVGPGVIHSKNRFSYEEAQRLIEGHDTHNPFFKDVRKLNELAGILREARFENGAIDFDIPEARVDLDEQGTPLRIVIRERKDSNKLIEEFMLLANRVVAGRFGAEDKGGFIFRVHEHPDREKLSTLARYVAAFGHELPNKQGQVDPKDLNALLRSIEGTPEGPIIEQAALRSMTRAHYDVDNVGHYGLATADYTHFTSPIRRYPDLIVHRLIRDTIEGRKRPSLEELEQTADRCSEREQIATQAERESVKLKQVEYVQNHVGEQFRGVLVGVTKFGIFVELKELLVEGMVHVRDMDGDFYEYDEDAFALVGRNTGRKYRLGDEVDVLVAGASVENREIDFSFVKGGTHVSRLGSPGAVKK